MPNLQKDFRPGSTKSGRNYTLTEFIHATFLSRLPRLVIFPVAIVPANKSVKIWTLDYSGKFWMRLVDTDLEALASTFLENRSYMRVSLKLVPMSSIGIRVTLSYLPRTGRRLISRSTTLYPAGLTRFSGHGGEKQDLEKPPY